MKRTFSIVVTFLALLLAHPSADLSAQILGGLGSGVPGEDAVSVGVLFGQMSPQTKFRDGGGFDSSTLIGGTLAFWVHKHLGLQGSVSGTEHVGLPASDGGSSLVSGRDPKIWTHILDALARYPLMTDGPVSISPYVALGSGWKTYHFIWDTKGGPDARGLDLVWGYAAGVDIRIGAQRRFGLRGEFRDLRTPMDRWGDKLTHQDRVLTGGLLLNF